MLFANYRQLWSGLTSSRADTSADSWSRCSLQPILLILPILPLFLFLILPLILQHVILQLILWGHDVTCPQADAVQDGTCW